MNNKVYTVRYTHEESFDTIEAARSFRDNLVKNSKYVDIMLRINDPFGDHFKINPNSADHEK
tara:strand:- start:842 stop:1027 length:186 start_codon:yes stop_codon:yes gene_type:complete